MAPLQLLNNPNENLVALNIFAPLLFNPDPIEVMDVFEALPQLDHFLLLFTQQSNTTFRPISTLVDGSALPGVQFACRVGLGLGVLALAAFRVALVGVVGYTGPVLLAHSCREILDRLLFIEHPS